MAEIKFYGLETGGNVIGVNGSGLGFYGASFGASVPVGQWQSTTSLTNAGGTDPGPTLKNVKYVNPTGCILSVASVNGGTGTLLTANSLESTFAIEFNHTSQVKVQNAQLRIYDRSNSIDYPATGVLTRVAELVNFGGATHTNWAGGSTADITAVGLASGDAFWWGAPWPSGSVYSSDGGTTGIPAYINSVGVRFSNFTDYYASGGSGNRDTRINLPFNAYPANQTVGGTGLIVPLLDSPGQSGKLLNKLNTEYNVQLVPKYTQYVNTTYQTNTLGVTAFDSGVTVNDKLNKVWAYGGTGYDTVHTWYVAISASPLSIGSKDLYALYVSLEYL